MDYTERQKKQWATKRANGTDIPWNKGMKFPELSGENHRLWKGGDVSYAALHHWLKRHKGRPAQCSFCETTEGRLEWANINKKYARNLDDYISLCVFCHRKYDRRDDSRTGLNFKLSPVYFNRWSGEWVKRGEVA